MDKKIKEPFHDSDRAWVKNMQLCNSWRILFWSALLTLGQCITQVAHATVRHDTSSDIRKCMALQGVLAVTIGYSSSNLAATKHVTPTLYRDTASSNLRLRCHSHI